MPGITPKVLDFARRVAAIGCTAVLPHLFGEPGRDPNPDVPGRSRFDVAATVCRRWCPRASAGSSPRSPPAAPRRSSTGCAALAAAEHERCGGPGRRRDRHVLHRRLRAGDGHGPPLARTGAVAAVDCRSAITKKQKRSIDISPADLDVVKHRCAADGLQVLGLRFKGDRFVPAERFEFLREQLGDAFVAVELDDDAANPDAAMTPHSVLTEHLIDEPGQPTRDALDQVLDLFRTRLLAPDRRRPAQVRRLSDLDGAVRRRRRRTR